MTEAGATPVLRLDRGKTFSSCHGERTPEDPQYAVAHWQGGKLRGHIVLLPFDSHDDLIADDGKDKPFKGAGFDRNGNPTEVTYHPLYTPPMREFLALKLQKLADRLAASATMAGFDDGDTDDIDADLGEVPGGGIDILAWLKGQARYRPDQIRTAVREKYSINQRQIRDIVIALVLDEQVISEGELSADLAKLLPAPGA